MSIAALRDVESSAENCHNYIDFVISNVFNN